MSYIWSKLRCSLGAYRRGSADVVDSPPVGLGCGFSWLQR